FEIVERELGLTVGALAADHDLPGSNIDLRNNGEMVANEKRVVRRDGGAEIFNRRLVVGRPIAELDQRLLAGQRIEHRVAAHPLRQGGGQSDRGRCLDRPQAETGAGERNSGARRLNEMPTCEHGGPSLLVVFSLARGTYTEYFYAPTAQILNDLSR